MQNYFNIILIVLSALLIAAILLQNRGSSLGGVFGGEGNIYQTKRGVEKFIFIFTIVTSILFLGVAFTNLILSSQ